TMRAGAPSTAAVRLSQRNRLAELRRQIEAVVAEQETAQARLDVEAAALGAAREAEKGAVGQGRAKERAVAEEAKRKTEGAGEATRAAERAAQEAVARADSAVQQARDRHVDVARRTDQLRTRLAAIEQSAAELATE